MLQRHKNTHPKNCKPSLGINRLPNEKTEK